MRHVHGSSGDSGMAAIDWVRGRAPAAIDLHQEGLQRSGGHGLNDEDAALRWLMGEAEAIEERPVADEAFAPGERAYSAEGAFAPSEQAYASEQAFAPVEAVSIHRREASSLSPADWRLVERAFDGLKANGVWEQYGRMHVDYFDHIHGMNTDWGAVRFLPWHRVFLFAFEQQLRSVVPGVALPYWDWSERPNLPQFVLDFAPRGGLWDRIRRPPARGVPLPTRAQVAWIQARPQLFPSSGSPRQRGYYSYDLEMRAHNTVHVWVDGIMAEGLSPIDPLFFLHHANVDRLWSLWQQAHPGQNPDLGRSPWGTEMKPFTGWSESNTRSIEAMGYDYV